MHILILHGIDGYAGIHWQQWLKKELEEKKNTVYMPYLPDADRPKRFDWLHEVKEILEDVPLSKLIIVAHSLGVVSALDFIEQSQTKVHGLISVAGFAEDYGSELNGYFIREKDINFAEVHKHLQEAHVLVSDDDPYIPQEPLYSLADWLGVPPEVIAGGGHFNEDAGYGEFPRLLEIIEGMTKKAKS